MEYNRAFDEQQNKLLNDQSRGPGLYQLDKSLRNNKPAYAWAPGTNVSREDKAPSSELTDIQSDLLNISQFAAGCFIFSRYVCPWGPGISWLIIS